MGQCPPALPSQPRFAVHPIPAASGQISTKHYVYIYIYIYECMHVCMYV